MDDTVYVWADGTYCYREDLSEYLTFMSDDYTVYTLDAFIKHFRRK